FESGCVKWLSGDPTWRNLTALNFHFETQPLPTWIGWYAHQLPTWVHQSDTVMMYAIEIGAPFLIFLARRPRQLAALAFVALQIFIMLTGNYCFFNLLTMALCLTLLDDAALRKCAPQRCVSLFGKIIERCRPKSDSSPASPPAAAVAVAPDAGNRSPGRRWPLV